MPAPGGELPYLDTFCKAAELLNFTAAAEAQGLTQAAVSQRIRALEQEVGAELFERQPGRVHLSPAGRTLYEYARKILALHDEARGAVGHPARRVLAGELHLAASTVPAEHLLPALLQEFRRRHPGVQVRADVADSAAVLEALHAEKVSLALVGRAGPTGWAESRPFARDRLVLIVPPGHRWAKRARVSLDDVATEPLVLREAGSGSRACFEEALRRAGRDVADFRVALQLGSNESIKEAILRGGGVALLSAFAVRHDAEQKRLHVLELSGVDVGRDLYVVTDRRRGLPDEARAFLEVVDSSPFARS